MTFNFKFNSLGGGGRRGSTSRMAPPVLAVGFFGDVAGYAGVCGQESGTVNGPIVFNGGEADWGSVADGDQMSAWNDQSGNGNDLSLQDGPSFLHPETKEVGYI